MALVDKIHVSTNIYIYIYITLYLTIQINNQNNEPYYLIFLTKALMKMSLINISKPISVRDVHPKNWFSQSFLDKKFNTETVAAG